MRVGVVSEIKPSERRVTLALAGVAELAADGHRVLVQARAGRGSGFEDAAYALAGAELVPDAADVWAHSELLLKVKEPHLVSREDLALMGESAVIVDVATDQGGCVATARPTTHDAPAYVVDGVLHYCVANMPGAVPRTSTRALTNATLPSVRRLASGVDAALDADPGLARGVNVRGGAIVHEGVEASAVAA